MENPTQPKSEAAPATRQPYPVPTSCGPLWVGLIVEPVTTVCPVTINCVPDELIWLRDADHAERVCKARKVTQAVFEWNGTRVQVDFADAESFADFVAGCRDELAFNRPVFDSEAEERLTEDAIRFLYAESERRDQEGGRA
jgi:hypothetical protein